MKRLIPLCLLLLLTACSKKLSPEEQALADARQAARESYAHLLAGRYDRFLEGRRGVDSLPRDYRAQLIAAYRQFMAQQTHAHGGIASFEVTNAQADSAQQLIAVFLMLNYSDSTREEIVVPMVQHRDRWMMK